MSYILDALKKADADREREAAGVPDLHAQADAARGAAARTRHGRGLLWVVLGAIAVAGLAWQWFDAVPAEAPPSLPLAQARAVAPPPAAPALPNVVAATPPPPQAVAPASPAAVAPEPAPIPSLASKPAPPPPSPTRDAVVAPAAPAVAAVAAVDSRVLSLAELPADLRAKLPALVVGGSMYSPNARSRMVILNGQVFREGDKPVDGLSVESIGIKSTVLAFRGVRFELKH